MSLSFRWLGAAGLVIKANGHALAIDPFLTRPTLFELLRPMSSNFALVRKHLPQCSYVLVTHSHYDHLMDVASVILLDHAKAYGSPNTYKILRSQGVTAESVHEVSAGEKLVLGGFEIDVVSGQHSWIPFSRLFNGDIKPGIGPPQNAWDYKMDLCLGYHITVQGVSFLIAASEPRQADVLFVVAQEPKAYYLKMLPGAHPRMLVPIHWDNFTRPLDQSLKKFTRPGRLSIDRLSRLVAEKSPGCKYVIPKLFEDVVVEPT